VHRRFHGDYIGWGLEGLRGGAYAGWGTFCEGIFTVEENFHEGGLGFFNVKNENKFSLFN